MNTTYKVALLGALALFVVVIVISIAGGSGPDSPDDTNKDSIQANAAASGANNTTPSGNDAPAPPTRRPAVPDELPPSVNINEPEETPTPAGLADDGPGINPTLSTGETIDNTPDLAGETENQPLRRPNSLMGLNGGRLGFGDPEPEPVVEPREPVDSTPIAQAPPSDTTPRTPEPSPSPTAQDTYTIQSGDNFAIIAERLYGEQAYWPAIAQANPEVDPNRLQVGQEINLPEATDVARIDQPRQADEVPSVPGEQRHVVQAGETLSGIAQQHYGAGSQWRYLYNVNRETIGDNPNRLRANMVLIIRPLPSNSE